MQGKDACRVCYYAPFFWVELCLERPRDGGHATFPEIRHWGEVAGNRIISNG